MGALFDDPAVPDDADAVGAADGAEAVGDDSLFVRQRQPQARSVFWRRIGDAV